MPDLKLYNSLTREREIFTPLDKDHVRVYACGPTVYGTAHIGNARMAVVFDQLVRLLRYLYPRVTYASNITDIEDKIIAAARETGQPIPELTERYTRIYNDDMAALGVAAPDVQPRATGHIPEMIALIGALIARGHAYAAEGHVLFSVPSHPAYGQLSGRSRDEQIAGARVEVAPYKKDPADFVLWKPSSGDEPGWESPWGYGRPGWHIECSAMSEAHLGLPFDIHGGGADLKFPHHENEIAQSCCAHGRESDPASFARVWVHNGFVMAAGEKMSKSLGNVIKPHDLLEAGARGETIRLALLSAQYRQPLDWTDAVLAQARAQLDRFYQILYDYGAEGPEEAGPDPALIEALCDDLNTPRAITALNELAARANAAKTPELAATLKASGRFLGVLGERPDVWLGYGQIAGDLTADDIEALLSQRQEARKSRDFGRADEIRDLLAAKGITIEDTASGSKWRAAH